MKKITLLMLAIGIVACAVSCKKSSAKKKDSYVCATCKTVPEALAVNDASSKGIYVGVFIGSTGTIEFNLANSGTTFTAVMVIDGTTVNLSSDVTWVSGQPYIAPFTGTLNGQTIAINFEVGASGEQPSVTSSDIPGHPNAGFIIAKETSTALIEAFEGRYTSTKPETGSFNIVLSKALGLWGAISRMDGSSDINNGSGTISGNSLIDPDNGNIATISGDEINGSFTDQNSNKITLTGKRTL